MTVRATLFAYQTTDYESVPQILLGNIVLRMKTVRTSNTLFQYSGLYTDCKSSIACLSDKLEINIE